MFKKFLKSKKKKAEIKDKTEKSTKKIKENKPKEPTIKEKILMQPSANKILTAEGWLRRQKKAL